ncbi:MAG: NAD(P)-dependent oxidoreductase [Elusimicrobiota bacterium]
MGAAAGKTVLVTTSSFCAQDPLPRRTLAAAGYSVVENPFKRKLTEDEVSGLLAEHRPVGMIAGVEPLTGRVIEGAAAHLKAISRCGVGLDSVDLSAAARLGIPVLSTPEAPSPAVAELTIALALAVLRRVAEADRAVRAGQWKALPGRLLGARKVGIVGLGRIGSKVAALAAAFGAEVYGCDRDDVPVPVGVKRVSFEQLLPLVDVLTLHVPIAPETRHLLDARRLALLPRGAIVINASRGGLVDEEALADALRSGALGGAGLDVFEAEPYKGPLKDMPQVVLTAHMGSAAEECRTRMEREAADNLVAALERRGS